MKSKGLFLVFTLRKVMLVVVVSILIATLLVSGCAAPKGETGFVKTAKVPRQKALLVPPGHGVKPIKVDEKPDGRAAYYDLNGNGIIDYLDAGDIRGYNFVEELIGNKVGFGWEVETRARGTKLFDCRYTVMENAPENIWVGKLRIDLESSYQDLLTGEETQITDEMAVMVANEYVKKRPHAHSMRYKWLVEYKDNEKYYYPFEVDVESLGHWPMTLEDWKEIKAKGHVLIEYW